MLNQKTIFFLALGWTLLIVFLSLVSMSSLKDPLDVPFKDKAVHFVFYFVFVNDILNVVYNIFSRVCTKTFTHVKVNCTEAAVKRATTACNHRDCSVLKTSVPNSTWIQVFLHID